MTHIDDAIRQALSAEDARALEGFNGEQSMIRQAFATLGAGPNQLIYVGGWLGAFLLFAAGVAFGWKFYTATGAHEMALWGGATVLAFIAIGLIKIWFFMELSKNQIIREVKRLELQVARLAARAQV
ncbi:MAG: hypothetical protein Q7T84_13115 [Phenylobacterium sp.]|uniref:DUF6768 family protein n=1 Tax=Phenylobacterium sp. TaxID=1871053 RepID=UPI002724343E|nr:DUF6768 family protein [Phenylobacterium sp.]MDO9432232.1 hypothetical protein [Phenylobacterium sp.]